MLPIRGDKKAADARTAGNRILRSEHGVFTQPGSRAAVAGGRWHSRSTPSSGNIRAFPALTFRAM